MGEGPWVNFSRRGEFNPMHNHTGIISSVVFIDIPDELEEEREILIKWCNKLILILHMQYYIYTHPIV